MYILYKFLSDLTLSIIIKDTTNKEVLDKYYAMTKGNAKSIVVCMLNQTYTMNTVVS
jgi:hypothetical protein